MITKGKVALIYGVPFGVIIEQIGVASICAYMRQQRYEVKMFCLEASDDVVKEVLEFCPNYIGFNTVTINISSMADLAKRIKKELSNAFIFFGGVGASGNIKEVLELYPVVDYVVYGEGEISVYELIERLRKGQDVEGCAGVAYREKNQVIVGKPRELIRDLDLLPFPARDILLENKEKMTGYLGSAMLETARGCCANCSFCDNYVSRQQEGPLWRGKSVKRVVDELQYLVEELQVKRVHIQDRTFEDPGELGMHRILEIANEIIKRKINVEFSICVRAEDWDAENKYILQQLKKAGLYSVQVGIEAGNNETLQLYNKRATIEDNVRIINILSDLNLIIDTGFIMFHPYNTFEELRANVEFLLENNLGHIKKNFFTQLELTPNTDLYNRIKKDNLVSDTFTGNTFEYAYIDDRIAKMIINIPKQASEDETFMICDRIHFEFSYLLQKLYGLYIENKIPKSYYDSVKEKKEDVFARLAELNYAFILGLLDVAEYGGTQEKISKFITFYDNSMYFEIWQQYQKIKFEIYYKLRRHGVIEKIG